jgi:hypothetical protein
MAHSFEEKLTRAQHHLDILGQEITRWRDSKPYILTDEIDPNTSWNVVYLEPLYPLPDNIPLTVGDCLHNLRASLDHLVHALAFANKPSLTDTEATETSFPIFRYSDGFHSRGKGRIRHVNPRAQAIIDGLQPYRIGDNAVRHWLWLLEKLNNVDKHRRLLVTIASSSNWGFPLPAHYDMMLQLPHMGPIHGKTAITRYRCTPPDSSDYVDMDFNVTLQIVFEDIPARGGEIVETLTRIIDFIKTKVFPNFTEFLT